MRKNNALNFLCGLAVIGLAIIPPNTQAQTQHYPLNAEPLIKRYEDFVITAPPKELNFHPFYKKYSSAGGIPVISSEKVQDAAILVARDIISFMLTKRNDVREYMLKAGARLSLMAYTEMQTDLPECSDWKKPQKDDKRLTPSERENYDKPGGIASMTDKEYWNKRARGMGGLHTSSAEENILGYPGTKYFGENILVHEWSHNILEALKVVDKALVTKLESAYEAAKSKGMYKNQYAINTLHEYWAEGTQWWFWSNYEFFDGKIRVQSPQDLKAYEPVLFEILAEVYLSHHIPADIYYGKNLR